MRWSEWKNYAVTGRCALTYAAFRAGLRARPDFHQQFRDIMVVVGNQQRWPERLRVITNDANPVPPHGGVIFAANHLKADDPFILFRACYLASGGARCIHHMMRDDFFETAPLWMRLIGVNDITAALGAYHISRGRAQPTQLKPFINLLRKGESFLMFPNGTRSRTGLICEYRDGANEPGAVAFFLSAATQPSAPPPAVIPVTRTFNPVNARTAAVFGPPLRLPPAATRHDKRALDFAVMDHIGRQVEVHIAHLVCGLLYLRCLQGRDPTLEESKLLAMTRHARDKVDHPYMDPRAHRRFEQEIRDTLAYLEHNGLLQQDGALIRINRERILHEPPHDRTYLKINPLKYIMNNISHLPGVVRPIEAAALD